MISLVCAAGQHRNVLPIAALVTKQADEIALFEHDGDEDAGGGHCCEQQMPGTHRRGRPERDDETEIDRVPDKMVVERRPEDGRGHLAADDIFGDWM